MPSGTEREETQKVASRCAVSPWQRTCSHIITSTDSHPKCQFQTAPSPTVFTRFGPQWLLFVSKTEGIRERTEIRWRWGCYLHCKWLARGPRSRILLQWNPGFVEKLDQVHFCWRGLCWKVTKYHVHIPLLTVLSYLATNFLNAPRNWHLPLPI